MDEETIFLNTDEFEEMECSACGASMTEIEIRGNHGCCWNCETPWDSI